MTIATVVQDANDASTYRVEAFDDDGACELALFSGPRALDRAIHFAAGTYYDGWADPQDLSRH
jgi:hypothetical protein